MTLYVNLPSTRVKLQVKRGDIIDDLAHRFVQYFYRQTANMQPISEHRLSVLTQSIAFMINSQTASLSNSSLQTSSAPFALSHSLAFSFANSL